MENEIELTLDEENVYLPQILQEEKNRQLNEEKRQENDMKLTVAENERKENELKRMANENRINENEEIRIENERQRQEKDEQRDEKITGIEDRLDASDEEIQAMQKDLEDIFINEIKQTKSFRDTESNTTYYITEIPYKDKKGNILKPQIGIANDDKTFSSGLESNISFAARKNATVSINAAIYNTNTLKPRGIIIQSKQILWDEQLENAEILAFKDDGILITYNASLFTAQQLIDDGVVNAVTGWYSILKNGDFTSYSSSEDAYGTHPRTIIGQKENGDYIIFNCDGRTNEDVGMNLHRCAEILKNDYNCIFAFNLDGGGSTSICYQQIKQNKNIDNYCEDREVSNFLYWSKSEILKNDTKDSFKQIALLKQEMIKMFINFRDVYKGYLKILSSGNYPGIEFYGNGNFDTRRGKLSMEEEKFNVSYSKTNGGDGTLLSSDISRGLYSFVTGYIGQFRDEIQSKTPSEFNEYLPTGIYLHNSSSTDAGIGQPAIVIVFTWLRTGQNTRQIYIPLNSKKNKFIMYREKFSTGNFTDWYPINSISCTTNNRPTLETTAVGTMIFDSTLQKPIWWTGNKWIDATGNEV